MKLVKNLGGQIETNERMTDQEAVNWISRPVPDGNDMKEVLDKLIVAEKNIGKDYKNLLTHREINQENSKIIKKHHQEAEANLQYFQTAKASITEST